jgi:protein associated with RNAse G/E
MNIQPDWHFIGDKWYHIVTVMEDDRIKVYLNGQLMFEETN